MENHGGAEMKQMKGMFFSREKVKFVFQSQASASDNGAVGGRSMLL